MLIEAAHTSSEAEPVSYNSALTTWLPDIHAIGQKNGSYG
jgi:hypothetical protein